jgi:predicted alpha/beta hydrolase
MKKIALKTHDNHEFELQAFAAANSEAPVFLICPAMAVKASYYAPFAEALQAAGFNAVLMELRGLGSSNKQPHKGNNFSYHHLVDIDWDLAVNTIREAHPKSKIVLLGNSLGGQMSALYTAANPNKVDALILIASCSVYYKAYKNKIGTLLGTHTLAAAAALFGYAPGDKLGFAGKEAKSVIYDWAYNARTGKYRASGSSNDFEALLPQVKKPVLAISLAKDQLAPKSAVEALLAKLPSCDIEHQHLSAQDLGLEKVSHYSWAKQPAPFVPRIQSWLDKAVS